MKSKPERQVSDPKEGAIKRLKNETDKLRQDQLEALKTETFLGATPEDKKIDDARRERISDLNMKIQMFRKVQHGSSGLKTGERNRLEELAGLLKNEPDDTTFEELVSELNKLLAKSSLGQAGVHKSQPR